MTLTELFQIIVADLRSAKARFALAGGLATSLYRAEERVTRDIDLLLLTESDDTEAFARAIVKEHQLTLRTAKQCDLEGGPMFGRKRSPVMIVCGKDGTSSNAMGVDFLLPEFPWFEDALERAEHHEVDFGFGNIPTLTVEDIVLAKLHALKNDATRFKDLDDLKSILSINQQIDLAYLSGKMLQFDFRIPDVIMKLVPAVLQKTSRRLRQSRK